MEIKTFSEKQAEILRFAYSDESVLICDGAVRSGKTIVMSIAFVLWAMENFDRTNFAVCGKTVSNAERNILRPFQQIEGLPFKMQYKISTRMLTVRCANRENYFYLFGGKDEGSQALIQGLTLAGVLFDEVALMPKSFVDQSIARTLSYKNAKLWFSCNPESPNHWFFKEWISDEQKEKKHLHFLMQDNPILGKAEIQRAQSLFAGVFYRRFILGEWVLAEGVIYPMFGQDCIVETVSREYTEYIVSMDYGIQNPTAMLLWGKCGGVWYQIKEYYHSGREEKEQKTDQQYYEELEKLVGDLPAKKLIVDPSATSFIALVQQKKRFSVWKANNDVVDGIQHTASCLQDGTIKVNDCCKRTIEEYGLYSWDDKAQGDAPIKKNDHAMDATRYFVNTTQIWRKKKPYQSIYNHVMTG